MQNPEARQAGVTAEADMISPSVASPPLSAEEQRSVKRQEVLMFVLLAFVIWPFIAVAVVGGYGFLVWMSQLVLGPPGPPSV